MGFGEGGLGEGREKEENRTFGLRWGDDDGYTHQAEETPVFFVVLAGDFDCSTGESGEAVPEVKVKEG